MRIFYLTRPIAILALAVPMAVAMAQDEEVATEFYPSLDDRELGEPLVEPDGEKVVWDRKFPFLAQHVVDLGIELPNPYGVSLVGVGMEQDLLLSDLVVSLGGGPATEIDFVDFGIATAKNTSVQARADMWLFPFMNLFAVTGNIDGEATVPLTFPVDDALEFLGLGALCPTGPIPPRPAFCDETVSIEPVPEYHGTNLGVGTVLAFGWSRYFVVLPVTYVEADLNLLDSEVETFNVSPRIGITLNPRGRGRAALFIGASYLETDLTLGGSLVVPLSDVDPSLNDFQLDYSIRQQNKDKWNYLAGFNYEFNKNWALQGELGFGGSRENVIVSGAYRW